MIYLAGFSNNDSNYYAGYQNADAGKKCLTNLNHTTPRKSSQEAKTNMKEKK
jgi:hypothetical protein